MADQTGWFYADSPEYAQQIAEDARAAAALFQRHFTRPAPRGAVLVVDAHGQINPEIQALLKSSGAAWVLPWLSARQRDQIREQQIREQIVAQLGERASDEIIEQALRQARSANDATTGNGEGQTEKSNLVDRGALRHEIGHRLLDAAFWPDTGAGDRAFHYGSPGPDWLDEVAAILMENDTITATRRAQLKQYRHHFPPLETFFTKAHPLHDPVRDQFAPGGDQPNASGGMRLIVLEGDKAQTLADTGRAFYIQARAFIDFLLEQSNDQAVFGDIARKLTDTGSSMTDWLRERGSQYGLPVDIETLEAKWQNWLADR